MQDLIAASRGTGWRYNNLYLTFCGCRPAAARIPPDPRESDLQGVTI
jgi:hypothetical protein